MTRSRHPSSLLLLLLLLSLQHPLTTAQTSPTSSTSPPTVPPNFLGRDFSISESSPLATILNQYPVAIQAISNLTLHFDLMHRVALHSSTSSSAPDPYDPFAITTRAKCSLTGSPWRRATNAYIKKRNWPFDRSNQCQTDVPTLPTSTNIHDNQQRDIHERKIQENFKAFATLIQDSATEIAQTTLGNWTDQQPTCSNYNFPIIRGSLQCSVSSIAGLRLNNLWHVLVTITNQPTSHYVADFERKHIREHIRLQPSDGKLVAARMTLPIRPDSGIEHNVTTRSTTSLSCWAGADLPSEFRPIDFERNFAVTEAVAKGDLAMQQVEDATTPSNIAIISLPLVMNLIPVALVADVSKRNMLFYAFLSDILTVLPMAIKGIELLAISNQEYLSVFTRIGDTSNNNSFTVAAEMWLSSCRTTTGARATGIVFLSVSLTLLLLGLVLEVVARRYMYIVRRKRELLMVRSFRSSNVCEGVVGGDNRQQSFKQMESEQLFTKDVNMSSGDQLVASNAEDGIRVRETPVLDRRRARQSRLGNSQVFRPMQRTDGSGSREVEGVDLDRVLECRRKRKLGM